MIDNAKQFQITNTHFYDSIELYMRMVSRSDGQKTISLPEPVVFKTITNREDEALATTNSFQPFLRLTKPEAQELLEELWRAGFRPANGTGSVGELRATQEHLKDMQHLVYEAAAVLRRRTEDD